VIPEWGVLVLAGFVALDGAAVGQFMFSRPLVAGFLSGMLVGQPGAGVMIGAVLELVAIAQLPSGGARLTEPGLAALIAVAAAAGLPPVGVVPLAVAFGLLVSEIGGFTVDRHRRRTGARWEAIERKGVTAARLRTFHWQAIGLDYLRGVGLCLLFVPLGRWVLEPLEEAWPLGAEATWALLLLVASVQFGVLAKDWGGLARRGWAVVGGALVGLGIGLWL